jgi:hypothetical protein
MTPLGGILVVEAVASANGYRVNASLRINHRESRNQVRRNCAKAQLPFAILQLSCV